jgi:hypothetical protein
VPVPFTFHAVRHFLLRWNRILFAGGHCSVPLPLGRVFWHLAAAADI